ncbi:unnamed protein product [Oppiella nova]|uniref:Uncharacterized protein n=1 Tax=Oppiella nova TaxID=334625 RepID=A0A7R9L934_9ACAR|nr:unnamed protein product [Oppiella nova]CAG2159390.1 unnamed protein product [Oppiella nova]
MYGYVNRSVERKWLDLCEAGVVGVEGQLWAVIQLGDRLSGKRYLVVVYVVTAGLHDDDLGCDEEETVLLAWVVVDQTNAKFSGSDRKICDISERMVRQILARHEMPDNRFFVTLLSKTNFKTTQEVLKCRGIAQS